MKAAQSATVLILSLVFLGVRPIALPVSGAEAVAKPESVDAKKPESPEALSLSRLSGLFGKDVQSSELKAFQQSIGSGPETAVVWKSKGIALRFGQTGHLEQIFIYAEGDRRL